MSLQVSNPTPLEGDVVEMCVVVTGVNASESDVAVVLFATDGLASECIVGMAHMWIIGFHVRTVSVL